MSELMTVQAQLVGNPGSDKLTAQVDLPEATGDRFLAGFTLNPAQLMGATGAATMEVVLSTTTKMSNGETNITRRHLWGGPVVATQRESKYFDLYQFPLVATVYALGGQRFVGVQSHTMVVTLRDPAGGLTGFVAQGTFTTYA